VKGLGSSEGAGVGRRPAPGKRHYRRLWFQCSSRAEPRRRQILDALAGGERPVNDLVRRLGLGQPQVSKHLRVLREVGAIDVRDEGRQRLYRLNGRALKPIHDWVKDYERFWSERFERLDVVVEDLKQKEHGHGSQ